LRLSSLFLLDDDDAFDLGAMVNFLLPSSVAVSAAAPNAEDLA
jgi:hypothetical protein